MQAIIDISAGPSDQADFVDASAAVSRSGMVFDDVRDLEAAARKRPGTVLGAALRRAHAERLSPRPVSAGFDNKM